MRRTGEASNHTSEPTSRRIFGEIQGQYRTTEELGKSLAEAYARHQADIPVGYGVARLLDAGQKARWIRWSDDHMIIVEPPSGAAVRPIGVVRTPLAPARRAKGT